jgi:carbonic anhydrase
MGCSMKSPISRRTAFAVCLLAVIMAGTTGLYAASEENHVWDYGLELGPEQWAGIKSEFATCGTGREQSPVDISGEMDTAATPISFEYTAGKASVVNNGHTVQVNVAPGSKLSFGDGEYDLLQFHFHTPSETTFEGLHYPLEAHFVHRNAEGKLAVVAVMIRPGAAGSIDTLPVPELAGETTEIQGAIDPEDFLPPETGYITFDGSLTTPPCSEGVRWIVLKSPVTTEPEVLSRFAAIIGRNNRPTHPLNGRMLQASE